MGNIKIWPDLSLIILGLMVILISGFGIAMVGVTWLQYFGAIILVVLIILNPYIGLCITALLIPIYALNTSESGGTLVRNTGILTFVAWLLSQMAHRKSLRKLVQTSISLPIGIFWFVCAVSVLWSANRNWWFIGFYTFTQLILFTFMLINMMNSFARIEQFLLFFSIGSLINAGVTIFQFYEQFGTHTGIFRVSGGASGSNLTSSILVTALPVLLFFAEKRNGLSRLYGFSGVLMLTIAITLTLSRTGIILTALFYLWILVERRKLNFRTIGLCVLLVIVITVLYRYAPWELLGRRFATVPNDLSLEGSDRAWLINMAFQSILANPFGYGARNLSVGGQYFIVHNMYLQVTTELGIVGLLAMVLICYRCLRNILVAKSATIESSSYAILNTVLMSLVLFLMYSFTGSSERSRILWMLFALAEAGYIVVNNASFISHARSTRAANTIGD